MKRRYELGLIPVFAALLSLSMPAQTGAPFLTPTKGAGTVKSQPDATVIRSQNVTVNFGLLRSPENRALTVPLFGRSRLTLIRERQEQTKKTRKSGLVWYGKVANEPGSAVVLSVVGETLAGNIRTQKGKMYEIRYIGNGVHSLREIDQSKFPNEGEPLTPILKPREGPLPDTCSTDPPTDIDVMVVYTAAAGIGAGGSDAMEGTIYLAVSETNQAYLNSQISQRLRLAHFEEVSYSESGNINTDLTRLQNGSDGFMDNVQSLRNTFAADVVVLLTENGGGFCGLGYMMQTVSNAFESTAYCVVARSCATGYYSFGHELGHNMGADHDCANATSTGPYSYNRGWVNTAPTSPATPWRTIMSYQTSPSSTRVQYFSNPNINYPVGGDPMGGTCPSEATKSADNHQVLNNSALTVANFRCSSPAASNVWMKDTWNDTGAQPDPLTAAEDMWKSPYIWVRNAQDTDLTHQHQHQNPEFGSTNWVYVKVHNGFSTTTSGNLEVYWAKASTGLSWPANWNLLTSIPVASFAAHSTKIVEAQWASLPGTGHYCLLARWNSASDPMATAETSDINANVRANNNLVWRNVDIVDLVPDASGDASFIVRNVMKERMTTSLVIRAPRDEKEDSFITRGQVSVRFDDALLKAWRRGGGIARGVRKAGRRFVITAPTGGVFEGIMLDRKASGQVTITMKRLPTTPKRRFIIDVIQYRAPRVPEKANYRLPVIGGLSYEIHTDKVQKY